MSHRVKSRKSGVPESTPRPACICFSYAAEGVSTISVGFMIGAIVSKGAPRQPANS